MSRKMLVLLLVLGFPAIPSADLVPLGEEQVVATTLPEGGIDFTNLSSPDSLALPGEFMVTWSSAFVRYGGSQPIDWGAGVFGRRIAADGQPTGPRLDLVPLTHKVDIESSAVAADAAGRYAVVWTSANEHHPNLFVRLRQFSPTGATLSAVLADRFGPGLFGLPPVAVTLGAGGRALAVWGQPRTSSPALPPLAGLLGRAFLPSGQPLLPRFPVTTRTPVSSFAPALGSDARGNAVLVYTSLNDEGHSTLYLRTYDRNGRERGGEVHLASSGAVPALAVHPGGRFVVAWLGPGGIRARLFDPPYHALGPAIGVTTGHPSATLPDVAIGPDGRFVVTWLEPDPETRTVRIVARGFDPQGAPLGAAVRVDHEFTIQGDLGDGLGATVAASASGTFLISWVWQELEFYRTRVISRLYGMTDTAAQHLQSKTETMASTPIDSLTSRRR